MRDPPWRGAGGRAIVGSISHSRHQCCGAAISGWAKLPLSLSLISDVRELGVRFNFELPARRAEVLLIKGSGGPTAGEHPINSIRIRQARSWEHFSTGQHHENH